MNDGQTTNNSPSNHRSRPVSRVGKRVLLFGTALSAALTWYFFFVSWPDTKIAGLIEIVPGRVYACRGLRPTGLATAHRALGVRGVVLLDDPPDAELIRRSCDALAMGWTRANIAQGGRAGAQAAVEALRVMNDPTLTPVLIVQGDDAAAAQVAALHLSIARGEPMSSAYARVLGLMGGSDNATPGLLMDWGGEISRAYADGRDIHQGPAGAER